MTDRCGGLTTGPSTPNPSYALHCHVYDGTVVRVRGHRPNSQNDRCPHPSQPWPGLAHHPRPEQDPNTPCPATI